MAHLSVKSLSLTAQVHLPTLADWKAAGLAWYRRILRRPRCAGLRALRHFDLTGLEEMLDVGSANGETAAAFRALAPRARIVAFEPNPFYLNRIRSRFRHDPHLSAEGCALSDRNGPLPLHVPAYDYTLFPELATLERKEAENWLASRLLWYDPLRLSVLEMPAQSRTLDSLGLNPSLVRIDTRCDASAVMKGGTDTWPVAGPSSRWNPRPSPRSASPRCKLGATRASATRRRGSRTFPGPGPRISCCRRRISPVGRPAIARSSPRPHPPPDDAWRGRKPRPRSAETPTPWIPTN